MPKFGYKHTEEAKRKMSEAFITSGRKPPSRKGAKLTKGHINKISGENSLVWKGEKAGIRSKHLWIKRKYGKADTCENCGSKSDVQWSNIDHKYMRVREDWNKLCRSCHKKQDYANGLIQYYGNGR